MKAFTLRPENLLTEEERRTFEENPDIELVLGYYYVPVGSEWQPVPSQSSDTDRDEPT